MRSSFADDGLTSRIAAGSGVEALLTVKLREAETVLRRAESQVTDAAISMVVERGEELAAELEIAEAQARDLRASLRGLANLWVQDGNAGRGRCGSAAEVCGC